MSQNDRYNILIYLIISSKRTGLSHLSTLIAASKCLPDFSL